MRIALFSYEYSDHRLSGGIGTYTRNAALMLACAGHSVDVFTSGDSDTTEQVRPNLTVHHIISARTAFSTKIAPIFAAVHGVLPFDVIEGPEYGADAAVAAASFPDVPLVVKLHAPGFTISEANRHYISPLQIARYILGAAIRGKIKGDPWRYWPDRDPERHHARSADLVVGNSQGTAAHVGKVWHLAPERLSFVPYSYEPSQTFLDLVAEPATPTVLFLGRLEVRKGVIELAKAIPKILAARPDIRFRLVGRDLPHPRDGRLLSVHIRELTCGFEQSIDIVDGVQYQQVPHELAAASICVFPSIWEAAGFVCMEAMAAGRPVIGSEAGGMAEFVRPGITGLLVPPFSPQAICAAILDLAASPAKRRSMGEAGRRAILEDYAPAKIAPLQIASYNRAIANAGHRAAAVRWH